MYDARILAMGGQAVAFVDNPTALFHNPAGLDHIERFQFTGVVTNLLVTFDAPFAGPGSEQDSGINYAPLMFLGAAGRIHERLTIGAGLYISTGFGGGFENVSQIGLGGRCTHDADGNRQSDATDLCLDPPQDQTVRLGVFELAVPIGIRITDDLRVGVSLRMPYARMEVDVWQEVSVVNNATVMNSSFFTPATQDVSGFGIPGVLLGIQYEPVEGLMLGFAYRSKIYIDMTGKTEVQLFDGAPTLSIPTSTRWYVPHMFRFGVAYRTLADRLLMSAEFKIQMHATANEDLVFELDNPLAPDLEIPFDWDNVYLTSAGVEFYATENLPLRLGFSIGRGATPQYTTTPFSPPPGILYAFYGGLGWETEHVSVDLGFSWGGGAPAVIGDNPGAGEGEVGSLCVQTSRDAPVPIKAGCPGTYEIDSYFIGLSVTYRLGRRDNVPLRRSHPSDEDADREPDEDGGEPAPPS